LANFSSPSDENGEWSIAISILLFCRIILSNILFKGIVMKFKPVARACFVVICALIPLYASAVDTKPSTIATLYQDKSTLVGQVISTKGKVVKVNNDIMGRNWIHIKDGTGDAKSSDLAITSKQTADVGDVVAVSGTVSVNKDFGSGYLYALLIEDATIEIKK
jgi:hypothetical protein